MKAFEEFLELFLVERVRWCIDRASSGCSRFENYSLEWRCFVGVMKKMMAHLASIRMYERSLDTGRIYRVSTRTAPHNRHIIWISSKCSNIILNPLK